MGAEILNFEQLDEITVVKILDPGGNTLFPMRPARETPDDANVAATCWAGPRHCCRRGRGRSVAIARRRGRLSDVDAELRSAMLYFPMSIPPAREPPMQQCLSMQQCPTAYARLSDW